MVHKNIIVMINLRIVFFTAAINFSAAYSQVITRPEYALKSHETLEISKIEITSSKTSVFLTIENRIAGGSFCADKNILVIYPDQTRLMLQSSSGIPVCPDAYKFRTAGEKLNFILIFPPLKEGTEWIDIVENCSDNCFSFYGVSLNNDLNTRISEALELAGKGKVQESVALYTKILSGLEGRNHGMEGAIYCDIIQLLYNSGKKEEAKRWYKKLLLSGMTGRERFIENLRSRGIEF